MAISGDPEDSENRSNECDDRGRPENQETGVFRQSTRAGTDRYPTVVGPVSDSGFRLPEVPALYTFLYPNGIRY